MRPNPRPEALGRPVHEFLYAYDVVVEMDRLIARDNAAKLWLGGMLAAAEWIGQLTKFSPVSGVEQVPTRLAIRDELAVAGMVSLERPRTEVIDWARGVYRMIAYARGLTDELPLRPVAEVTERLNRLRAA